MIVTKYLQYQLTDYMVRLKLLAVLLLLSGVLFAASTGAFQVVTAERTTSINTAGDASALLQLTPYSGQDGNGEVANIENGQLEIPNLNVQSTTDFKKVFTVSNHGTRTVAVWITDEGDNPSAITFYNTSFGGAASCENGVKSIEGQANAVELDVGDSIIVSLFVDTMGLNPGAEVIDTMVIHADASVDGATSSGSCSGQNPGEGEGPPENPGEGEGPPENPGEGEGPPENPGDNGGDG